MDDLTSRQREVLSFINQRISEVGYPPTVREIGDAFNIGSPNGVICHLKSLEKKGKISRDPTRSRGITVLERPQKGMPLLTLSMLTELHQERYQLTDLALSE